MYLTKQKHFPITESAYAWLRVPVSNTLTDQNTTNETHTTMPSIHAKVSLNDEEKIRLIKYFSVLIEMDRKI